MNINSCFFFRFCSSIFSSAIWHMLHFDELPSKSSKSLPRSCRIKREREMEENTCFLSVPFYLFSYTEFIVLRFYHSEDFVIVSSASFSRRFLWKELAVFSTADGFLITDNEMIKITLKWCYLFFEIKVPIRPTFKWIWNEYWLESRTDWRFNSNE